MSKGWTEERRKKQAEAIRRWKPWEKSTGPKTEAGKNKTSMNAFREGSHSASLKEIRQALRCQREFLKHLIQSEMLAAEEKNRLLKSRGESAE